MEQEKQIEEAKRKNFWCEHFKALIPPSTCLTRQEKAQKASPLESIFACKDCKQGKEIKKLVEKAKKQHAGLGTCISCGKFTLIKAKNLCDKCYYHFSKKAKKEDKNMEGNKNISDKNVEKLLYIDFTDFPELWDFLINTAKNEFRTPEMQVLYWINEHVKYGEVEKIGGTD